MRASDDFVHSWHLEGDDHSRNPLLRLLANFASLVARVLHIDSQMNGDPSDDTVVPSDLVSASWIDYFCKTLVDKGDVSLWRFLRSMRWEPDAVLDAMITAFAAPPADGFAHLANFISLTLGRSPLDMELVGALLRMASLLIERWQHIEKEEDENGHIRRPSYSVPQAIVKLFRTVNEKLQDMISKQASCLNVDTLTQLIRHLSGLLHTALVTDGALAEDMVPEGYELQPHEAETAQEFLRDRATLIDSAWRMELYKKCIIHGRMDSRITGVESMQGCLVEIWRKYIQHKTESHPHHVVVEYLADFILKTKLVHYLVGVESHPQIIHRSKNIIGFLVVTGRYTDEQTDVIWNSVLSSQDSRTVDAILDMLKGILELCPIHVLVYLCKKITELPISVFDGKMTMYCAQVTSQLIRVWRPNHLGLVDLTPYWLMVRLIRQSAAEPKLPPSRRRELWNFATQELRALMHCRIEEKDKLQIFKTSLDDIRGGAAAAAASPSTLAILLEPCFDAELIRLNETFDITTLVVEDMGRLRQLEDASGFGFPELPELMADRLRVVQKIVLFLPDTLTSALVSQLWDSLVGSNALSDLFRDMAWSHLAKAASQTSRRNSFFDACLTELLPSLDPSYYTLAVLDFATQLTEYDTRMANASTGASHTAEDLMRGEIFRHIALSVPSQDIGARAISLFVRFNLENPRTRTIGRLLNEHQQKRLVDSCVEHLKTAITKLKRLSDGSLSGEEDSMVIVPSESDVFAVKLRFARTFAILKEFMQGVRSQSSSPPQRTVPVPQATHPPRENEISIRYQPHIGGKPTGVFNLNLAEDTTVQGLFDKLKSSTGFSEIVVVTGGRKIDLQSQKFTLLGDIKAQLQGLVLVQRTPGSKSTNGPAISQRLLPLETEIMSRFGELYELLSIDDELGRDVFQFLTTFPPHESITTMVASNDKSWTDVFPSDAPYKAIYSVFALKGLLLQKLQEGDSCHSLLHRGISVTGDALTQGHGHQNGRFSDTDVIVIQALADCLLMFLKEPSSMRPDKLDFGDPRSLVGRLNLVIASRLDQCDLDINSRMVCVCFELILQASMRSSPVWQAFKDNPQTAALLAKLWLGVSREEVRNAAATALKNALSKQLTWEDPSSNDLVSYFWSRIVVLVPSVVEQKGHSEQFFEIAVAALRSISDEGLSDLPLRTYVLDWTELLLGIQHNDFPAKVSVEMVVAGLSRLLHQCIKAITSKGEPLDVGEEHIEAIFALHLFTPIHFREVEPLVKVEVPILESGTRGSLYSLLLAMSVDLTTCQRLLTMAKDLLPEREASCGWSHGIAQIENDFSYDLTWNFDRWKAIRSNAGYVGIRNLSNTCYMNSLLTQLFMNAKFRDFILSSHLADPYGTQKLLSETQALFAYLQETWLKAVDPENVTNQIITYDSTQIDVSIQMDVDEFYNLLFDRWEAQMLTDQAKKELRQFYGGQLVQQIKSRDCPHVSERMEPFSAIQCDIQGKSSLVDSLNAYVEGEMMEGDNKYSCSSCGSYVNAVKRACLKDIPDSLIFHLKRFDYDLMTGMRNKINEYFEFPRDIDMAIYNIDYLKDPQQKPKPDRFTLVGVLVHSGNAEAGHYYSYIRERPHSGDSWIEFNDSEVSHFDPTNIKDQCFGGWAEQPYAGVHYPKTWSAYMLFYQRVSSMEADEEKQKLSGKTSPVAVDVPVELANRLNTENEEWIRRFCLFDPEHAKFTKGLLEQYRKLTKDTCSDDHEMEQDVISFILQHLERILCRQKDSTFLNAILDILTHMVERCAQCCRIFLYGVLRGDQTLKTFLLKCPDETMRRNTASMMSSALNFLRAQAPHLYDPPSDASNFVEEGALTQCASALKTLQLTVYQTNKAWEDYFGLLVLIASMGRRECEVLHQAGFLEMCLQILIIDNNKALTKFWPHIQTYVKLSEKRKYSFRKLVALVSLLISHARDLDEYQSNSDDVQTGEAYSITSAEGMLLKWTGQSSERHIDREDRGLHFLDRVLRVDNIDTAVCQEIVRSLLRIFDDKAVTRKIFHAITQGCTIEPAVLARPHLNAALAFCETCSEPTLCRALIERFAKEVQSINMSGGEEHLEFFESARRLQNQRFSTQRPMFFKLEALKTVHLYAPHLLIYPDVSVRARTTSHLQAMIFDVNTQQMDDEKYADAIEQAGQMLVRSMVALAESLVKQNKPMDASRVEDFSNVVHYCISHYMASEDEEYEETVVTQAKSKYCAKIDCTCRTRANG